MSFRDKFTKLREEKHSVLCVGIDPALPRQRKDKTIPKEYLAENDENQARLSFCLDIVDLVKDHAICMKPNQQYVFGFTKNEHQILTNSIRKNGMISILDYKLNDISDTVNSAMFHLSEAGYDAITFNPLPGNMKTVVKFAHNEIKKLRGFELGIIVLTLMSNPEALTYMKKAQFSQKPLFEYITEEVRDYDADGCVVGATGHVTEKNIRTIRKIAGPNKIFLVPGIGVQKGDAEKVIRSAGKNVLINVGRDIIYSENPRRKAKEYAMELARTAQLS